MNRPPSGGSPRPPGGANLPAQKMSGLLRLLLLAVSCALALRAAAATHDWSVTLEKARGQTVYWNAWGGDELINRYIDWTAGEVKRRYGVEVRHVKLGDTAEAVTRVLAEKAAGRVHDGSTDVIWINGENFASMKQHGLLYGPFTDQLPNFRFADTVNKPTLTDFTVPVDGLEAPWSMAQFVLLYDTARVPEPPRTPAALLEWAKAHPRRFTYPQPPDFLGTTFLKQLLLNLTTDRAALYRPVIETNAPSAPVAPREIRLGANPALYMPEPEPTFATVSAPLWKYLDQLRPALWRQGRVYPASGPAQTRLLSDGEVDLALSFSAESASAGILTGQLPDTIRTFIFEGGTIGNASFLAIPYNSRAKEGALVLINFLLSPEAQARKQDPRVMGSQTVLALDKLPPAERKLFDALPRGQATLSPEELGQPLAEPHPSWMDRLEKEWQQRYGNGH